MNYTASRVMHALTASYGVFALVKPEHLGNAMNADADERGGYDTLARAYGIRDLPISALGIFGPDRGVQWATRARLAGDFADCLTLAVRAPSGQVRAKVMGVTLGWAALNYAAYRWDLSQG